jgi:L-lactate dehydrogenase complex protein LldG
MPQTKQNASRSLKNTTQNIKNLMSTREKILAAVHQNQPKEPQNLPDLGIFDKNELNLVGKFTEVLTSIGGRVVEVKNMDEIRFFIQENFKGRMVSSILKISDTSESDISQLDVHDLENVEFALLKVEFGVAENGAVWLTEAAMLRRPLPFICQHLGVILEKNQIEPTMHAAYSRIGQRDYGFAAFVAGPSKTADIEQSLVLGAHGARTMTVFLID